MYSPQQKFERLFQVSRSITPYLDGHIAEPSSYSNNLICTDCHSIQSLYLQISKNNPEAGQAYWITRTWDLLCWQPVFVAFVSIYTQKSLPAISQITQYKKECFVSGYSFEPHQWNDACRKSLIQIAADQLNELFERYRCAINEWGRIRPGFTNHLLADQLLSCLVRLQELRPSYSNLMILRQAKLWLDAFNLPLKHLESLKLDSDTERLKLVRSSCCNVYKCDGVSVCPNCPRLEANKASNPNSVQFVAA